MNDLTRRRAYKGPRILSQGFRPFFLAAAIWAALAQAAWLAMLGGWAGPPTAFDPISWHVHELMFGFVAATIAGFMLTAIPNWTGRLPVRGAPLALLIVSWLAGRAALATSAVLGAGLTALVDSTFLAVLFLVVTRELVAGRNWRNLPMAGAAAALLASNLAMHAEVAGWVDLNGASWRLALSVVIILVSLIGGRIIPSFTRNWLAKNGRSKLPAPFGMIDKLALGLSVVALIAWTAAPDMRLTGGVLLSAGAAWGARIVRWRGLSAVSEPLVLVLHIAYAWGAIGLCLLGAAALIADLSQMLAIHALTIGLIGGMILAVMTRATLGHTGRPLHADRATVTIYLGVNLAALLRICAEIHPAWALSLIGLSAAFWIGAFSLFAIIYGRYLLGAPRQSAVTRR